jgi:hypothetical protein
VHPGRSSRRLNRSEQKKLNRAEAELAQVRKFLSETDVPFVLYAADVKADGRIVGLPKAAEQRLYIEGNALNSLASKEEVIKYENFSPVVLALQEERLKHVWMDADYIEEDSKSISSASPKLFTLSALVQAFSLSIVGHNKPLRVGEHDFENVEARREFVSAFWTRVSEVLGSTWVPDSDQSHGERVAYLQEMRGEEHRNVLFQAVFLMALGRLCYQMGKQSDWKPEHPVLGKLAALSPDKVRYDAVLAKGDWDERWANAMMKQTVDTKTMKVTGRAFNNTRENVETTFHELAKLAGFLISRKPDPAVDDADKKEVVADAAE